MKPLYKKLQLPKSTHSVVPFTADISPALNVKVKLAGGISRVIVHILHYSFDFHKRINYYGGVK